MQIYRSKVPFYVNISNPDRVQTFLTGFNSPVYCIFYFLKKKKKEQEKLDFQSSTGDMATSVPYVQLIAVFVIFYENSQFLENSQNLIKTKLKVMYIVDNDMVRQKKHRGY